MSLEESTARLLKLANDRKQFAELEDGYVRWFPSGGGGISAWELRALADEHEHH